MVCKNVHSLIRHQPPFESDLVDCLRLVLWIPQELDVNSIYRLGSPCVKNICPNWLIDASNSDRRSQRYDLSLGCHLHRPILACAIKRIKHD